MAEVVPDRTGAKEVALSRLHVISTIGEIFWTIPKQEISRCARDDVQSQQGMQSQESAWSQDDEQVSNHCNSWKGLTTGRKQKKGLGHNDPDPFLYAFFNCLFAQFFFLGRLGDIAIEGNGLSVIANHT